MPEPPLTHHEILGLVRPFTVGGRHVDLGASNRLERRLVFKPRDHAGDARGTPDLRETLQLESLGAGHFRLTRTLAPAAGPPASLQACGADPGTLLAQVDAVAPFSQFSSGPGYLIARSHALQAGAPAPADGSAAKRQLLTCGVVQCDGLRLTLTLPAGRRGPAEIVLAEPGDEALDLPEDLLAVLGWNWARLARNHEGWKTRLRLHGNAARRSRSAETALERAAEHLARTLAEPPARYHERQVVARWGVFFRRAIPALTAAMLILTAANLPHVTFDGGPGAWIMLFHLPTALLVLSFYLQEMSQFEIPPRPRRCDAARWQSARQVPCAALGA